MANSYWNVSPRSVLDTFRSAAPCNCHQERPYSPPTYNVRTTTSSTYIHGRGPIIKRIRVECTSCGAERETDVEYMDVPEKNFNPY